MNAIRIRVMDQENRLLLVDKIDENGIVDTCELLTITPAEGQDLSLALRVAESSPRGAYVVVNDHGVRGDPAAMSSFLAGGGSRVPRQRWFMLGFLLTLLLGDAIGFFWGWYAHKSHVEAGSITLSAEFASPKPPTWKTCETCGRRTRADAGETVFGTWCDPVDREERDELGAVTSRTWTGCFRCLVETIEVGARKLGRTPWKGGLDWRGNAWGRFDPRDEECLTLAIGNGSSALDPDAAAVGSGVVAHAGEFAVKPEGMPIYRLVLTEDERRSLRVAFRRAGVAAVSSIMGR